MRKAIVYALPMAVAFLACDKEHIDPLLGGEGGGSEGFRVVVTDQPGLDDATLDGTVTGRLRVALRNDAGSLVSLGTSDVFEMSLHEGADTVVLENISRPGIDDYTAVQLSFEGVDADVRAGSLVGDSTLANDVTLELGGAGTALVEVLVPVFAVDAGSTFEIVIDLNSEAWVTDVNLGDLVVSQSDLTNAVRVNVR